TQRTQRSQSKQEAEKPVINSQIKTEQGQHSQSRRRRKLSVAVHDVEHPITGTRVPDEAAQVAQDKSAQRRGPSQDFAAGRDDIRSGESRARDGDEQRNQRYPAE